MLSPADEAVWRGKDGLRSLVAALMDADTGDIDDTASLIDLGLDSVNIMRVPLLLKPHGYDVAVADLIKHPSIDAWWALLERQEVRTATTNISAMNAVSGERFALTPVQQAYLIGRQADQELGGNACHLYCEFDGANVDPVRLEEAIKLLCRHHPMLRATFFEDGYQQILEKSPWSGVAVHDFSNDTSVELKRSLEGIRKRLSHRKLDVLNGEVFDISLSLLPGQKTRIHFNIDLLIADVQSITIFLRDLATAFDGEPLPACEGAVDFRTYLSWQAESGVARREGAARYWRQRLTDLPSGPRLPLAQNSDQLDRPRFARREFRLTSAQAERLGKQAADRGLTLAATFASAFTSVLGRWSEAPHFLLNVPLFNRQEITAAVSEMIGDFTSLALVEVDTSTTTDFVSFARSVQSRLHQDMAHGAYSGVEVLREIRRTQPSSVAPVVLACNFAQPLLTERFEHSLGKLGWTISQTPQVWLDHQIYRLNDGFLLNWDAVEALFPDGLLDAMFETYQRLIRNLCDGRWQEAAELPLPVPQIATRARVNATTINLDERLLHEPFLSQAELTPNAPALFWSDGHWTYSQLRERAHTLALALVSRGLSAGDHVAVQLPKGPDQIAAVLGILMAGAVYVPVALDGPPARLARILTDAGCRHAFTTYSSILASEMPDGLQCLDPRTLGDVASVQASPLPTRCRVPSDLAYLIYTSGSTGTPKGVKIDHQGALNTVLDVNRRWSVTGSDRLFGLSSLTFDLSVYDIFGAFAAGAALVLPDEDGRRDPDHWCSLADRYGVSVWNSVPALIAMLVEHAERRERQLPKSLRIALLSGDWIPVALPDRLRARADRLELVGLGGATEASIWSNWFQIDAVDPSWPSIPYGYPLANQRYHILDHRLRPCPDWVTGELHIAGSGLAKGYWNDDEKTARSFIISPDGERLYRTGDRGRYWPDGTIEFQGRCDQQVKIGGYRIELGEIDAALTRIPGVAQALSEVRTVGGQRQIVAYLVPVASAEARAGTMFAGFDQIIPAMLSDDSVLKEHLSRSLPDYMFPRACMMLSALPLTTNGKVDRAQLPEFPEIALRGDADWYETSSLHQSVAIAWAQCLGLGKVPPGGNFFDLGGDSLLAIRVMSDLGGQLGFEISVRHIFEHPVLADFVSSLAKLVDDAEAR